MLVACGVAQGADAGGDAARVASPWLSTDCTSLVEGGGVLEESDNQRRSYISCMARRCDLRV
jgi:hypothetical protein